MDTPARIGMAIVSVAERTKLGPVEQPIFDAIADTCDSVEISVPFKDITYVQPAHTE